MRTELAVRTGSGELHVALARWQNFTWHWRGGRASRGDDDGDAHGEAVGHDGQAVEGRSVGRTEGREGADAATDGQARGRWPPRAAARGRACVGLNLRLLGSAGQAGARGVRWPAACGCSGE